MSPSSSNRDTSVLAATFMTALLVVIATAGAAVGLGLRIGDALAAFRGAGTNVLFGFDLAAGGATRVVAGMLHHVLLAGAWGLLLSPVALRLRLPIRTVACVLLVPLYVYIVPRVISPAFQIGSAVTNRDTDLFSIAVALCVALLGGAWVVKRD